MLTTNELNDIATTIKQNGEYEDVDILKKPVLKQLNFFLKKEKCEIRTFQMTFSKPIMLDKQRPARLCFIGEDKVFVGYVVDNDDFVLIDKESLWEIIDYIGSFMVDKVSLHENL